MNLETLYNLIPFGKEEAAIIFWLAKEWGISERRAQEIINEKMNEADLIVCRTPSGKYYRPKTYGELEEYYERHHAHTKKCEKQDYRIKKVLDGWRRGNTSTTGEEFSHGVYKGFGGIVEREEAK
jgi:hypothetical protein